MSFSFLKFMGNSNPVFANDNLLDDSELSPDKKDAVFRWQVGTSKPKKLDPCVFYIGGICGPYLRECRGSTAEGGSTLTDAVGAQSQSTIILEKLKSLSIISSHPDDFTVYTSRINRDLANRLAIISVHSQRKLVSMLFFWEEELVRWNLLEKEQDTINKMIAELKTLETDSEVTYQQCGVKEELKLDLARIEARKRTLPSRREVLESPEAHRNVQHVLPDYDDERNTVRVMGAKKQSISR